VAAEVANIYRAFTYYFIGLGGWPFMQPVIPWVPIPFKEAVTESPHDIKSNRCIDFKKKKKLLSGKSECNHIKLPKSSSLLQIK